MRKSADNYGLTKQQWVVVRMKAGGMSVRDISKVLFITSNSTNDSLKRAYRKLNAAGHYVYDGLSACKLVEQGLLEWHK